MKDIIDLPKENKILKCASKSCPSCSGEEKKSWGKIYTKLSELELLSQGSNQTEVSFGKQYILFYFILTSLLEYNCFTMVC